MYNEYLYTIKLIPDKQGHPTGEWLRFDGHCEVVEVVALAKPQEPKDNSRLATLPHLNP